MGYIVVVGGAGYIGTHMVKRLLDDGHEVIIIDNLSTGHADLLPGGEFVEGDLGDPVLLEHIFSTKDIDAVMHFAAFSLVAESVNFPLKYYENNVSKTVNLLNKIIINGINNFVFSSSAAVYGEPQEIPITEAHHCIPTSPYGTTKLIIENILQESSSAYGLRSISLRYFNAAGADESAAIGEKHDPESHLIPLVLKTAIGDRKEISIFGNDYDTPDGTAIRDYIHVNDLVDAHMLALEALLNGKKTCRYNLGNGKGYSVKEVIECAQKVTNRKIETLVEGRRPGDPAVLIASSEKIENELGWRPKYTDLGTIIETAWGWHSSN